MILVIKLGFAKVQKCSSLHKLVILLLVSSCYCFGARGIVSVVCSIVLSKDNKPFIRDLTRTATQPLKIITFWVHFTWITVGEKWTNGEENFGNGKSWTPTVFKNVQTDHALKMIQECYWQSIPNSESFAGWKNLETIYMKPNIFQEELNQRKIEVLYRAITV